MEVQTKSPGLWDPRSEYFAGAVAFLVYAVTLSFQFVYDDVGQIVDNPALHSWSFLPQYFAHHVWAGLAAETNYYRPLNLVWFRVNYALFGLNAQGWHLAAVLLHAFATILAFRLVKRLTLDLRLAAISALIFGLHPIHVQSVAWVSGTADPLLAVFLIAGFLAYLDFREERKISWLFASLLLYGAAVFTKEPGVVLPLLIFAYELFPSTKQSGDRSANRVKPATSAILPFLAVAAIYFAARIHALHSFAPASSRMSISQMVLTWPSILWFYVEHLFLPWGYSLFYELPPVQHFWSREFLLPSVCLLLTAALFWVLSRVLKLPRATLFIAAIWFAIPLLPALYLRAVDPEIFGQDRYMYVSCLGFAIFVSAVITSIPVPKWRGVQLARLQLYLALSVVAILAFCTLVQEQYWASNVALFRRALSIAPNNNQALNNLAVALAERNDLKESVPIFERAIVQNPNSAKLLYNYAYTLYRMGLWNKALPLFARAIELDPTNADAFLYAGMSHFKLGFHEDAAIEIRRAITLDPRRRGAHLALGAVLQSEGNLPGAIEETQRELNNYPDDEAVRQRLAGLQREAVPAGKHPST